MKKTPRLALASLALLALTTTAQEPPAPPLEPAPEPAVARPPEKVFALVNDPLHVVETIYNGAKIVQQLRELEAILDSAERNLDTLLSIPLVDRANFTGAFLENMLYNLDVASAWSFHREDVEEVLGEHFVGVRSAETYLDPGAYPPGGVPFPRFWQERQDEMIHGLLRRYAILEEHTRQLSRERQGLAEMRDGLDDADGESQHLEHIAAALHQIADAQSVERHVAMLDVSQRLLDDLAEVSGAAETTSFRLATVLEWRKPQMPLHRGGLVLVPHS